MDPRLPPELEHKIFEISALVHPGMVPTLLRVARRVQIWIEPLLYRLIWFDHPPNDPRQIAETNAVLAAMESKATSVFREVRNLFLKCSSGGPAEKGCSLLRLCPNVVKLFLSPSSSSAEPQLVTVLGGMHICKLSVWLPNLFGAESLATGIDFTHPLFISITHLHILNRIEMENEIYPGLTGLPALTHLALNQTVLWDALRKVLYGCKKLAVLVNLWPMFRSFRGREFSEKTPFSDTRFVVTAYTDLWREWRAGAEGGMDFWTAANGFIARKQRGEISNSCYWLDPL
ncbi:hypothetical protein B0H13DRAFT_2116563 [Mycena leptocephala]|nr:hypothetical protein B0H13DRAFT_2116563 [Mycena leptocephala]